MFRTNLTISCFGRSSLVDKFFIFINLSPTNCLQPTTTCCLSEGKIKKFRCGRDFALLEQFLTQQLRSIFTIICFGVYALLREMPFVFPRFLMTAIPYVNCDVGCTQQNPDNTIKISFLLFRNMVSKKHNVAGQKESFVSIRKQVRKDLNITENICLYWWGDPLYKDVKINELSKLNITFTELCFNVVIHIFKLIQIWT